jgi:hypothetical protein
VGLLTPLLIHIYNTFLRGGGDEGVMVATEENSKGQLRMETGRRKAWDRK